MADGKTSLVMLMSPKTYGDCMLNNSFSISTTNTKGTNLCMHGQVHVH